MRISPLGRGEEKMVQQQQTKWNSKKVRSGECRIYAILPLFCAGRLFPRDPQQGKKDSEDTEKKKNWTCKWINNYT